MTNSREKMTISEAAQKVLAESGSAIHVDEIYNRIIKENLYEFKAKDPKAVLKRTIRQHSNLNSNAKIILFVSETPGIYSLQSD